MYLAAVFSNGHITTGRHHGEAFSKLSCEDQEADLISGHLNDDGTFTTEMTCVHKEIILIRHAESMWNVNKTDNLDSNLTPLGITQSHKIANYIKKHIDCRDIIGYTSPFDRCLLTSMPIRRQTGIKFIVRSEISEVADQFPDSGIEVICRNKQYFDFDWQHYSTTTFHKESCKNLIDRLNTFINLLPNRSIVITHAGIVQVLIEMALGVKVSSIPNWGNFIDNASITHIKDGTVVCLAKNIA